MSKIDPTTLIGRTWGSLSAEERASLPDGSWLGPPANGCLMAIKERGFWYGHNGRIEPNPERVVASVPS